jgi:hypothetical protein
VDTEALLYKVNRYKWTLQRIQDIETAARFNKHGDGITRALAQHASATACRANNDTRSHLSTTAIITETRTRLTTSLVCLLLKD